MHNYLVLTKTLFKCGSDASAEKTGKKGRFSKISGPFLYLLIFVCVMPLMFGIFKTAQIMYSSLVGLGSEGSIISMAVTVGSIATLAFGITMIITYFYTTSDLPILLALPLTPTVIVSSKFTLCIVYDYLIVMLMSLPMLLGYGVASGGGIVYWINAIVILLLLPIVPVCYATIFIMLFMRIFRRARNKNVLTMVSTILALVIAVSFSFLSQNMMSTDPDKFVGTTKTLSGVNYVFPQFTLAISALTKSSLICLILYILSVAATFGVFLLIARIVYFKGAIGMTEVSASTRELNSKEQEKYAQKNAPIRTYMTVEIQKVLRSPTNFLNGVLMILIWPVLFVVPTLMPEVSNPDTVDPLSISNLMRIITGNAKSEMSFGIVMIVFFAVTFIFGSLNLMTSSTVSREGGGLWFMKTIPMSYKKQLQAKMLSSVPFTLVSALLYGLIFGIIGIVNGMTPLVIVYMILITIPGVALINYIQLLFDLRWPKLVWQNEAVPMKQNMHAIGAWGVCCAVGVVVAAAGLLPYIFLKLNIHICILIVIVILFVLALIFRPITYRYGQKRMMELF